MNFRVVFIFRPFSRWLNKIVVYMFLILIAVDHTLSNF